MTRIATTDLGPFLHGAASLEPGDQQGVVPHRLAPWARAQMDDMLFRFAEACPTGTTLRFSTTATDVILTMAATTVAADDGSAPVRGPLVVATGRSERVIEGPVPTVLRLGQDNVVRGIEPQPPQAVILPIDEPGSVVVYLPHNQRVELVSLEASGDLVPLAPSGPRWTHYGSSISQGMNAVSAVRTWPVAAARRLGWNLRNLAFSGNAQFDGFAARLIRDIPADIITLKVGINLVNADSMRERAFRPAAHAFLDTIREGQPDTPIVVITALSCPIHEHAAGPVMPADDGLMRTAKRDIEVDTGALTLARTREILEDVVAGRHDNALRVWDGRDLFGESDTHLLYDRLHPDQEGLDLIADRFVARADREDLL